MMLESEVVSDVLDQLNDKCFYKEANRKIFEAIKEIATRNDKVDILTVADELSKMGVLEEVGGAAYLSEISMRLSAAANTDYHCKSISNANLSPFPTISSAVLSKIRFL